jgi:hypothetical protein
VGLRQVVGLSDARECRCGGLSWLPTEPIDRVGGTLVWDGISVSNFYARDRFGPRIRETEILVKRSTQSVCQICGGTFVHLVRNRSRYCSARCVTESKRLDALVKRRSLEAIQPEPPLGCRWLAITSGQKRFVFALVDADVFEAVCDVLWGLDTAGYAFKRTGNINTYLHWSVFGDVAEGLEVDHINRDRLDNRRANLRVVTHAQNMANHAKRITNTSGYRGVKWARRQKRWVAQISVNNVRHHLGFFLEIEDAARARDAAAKRLLGEFAQLNFPDEVEP